MSGNNNNSSGGGMTLLQRELLELRKKCLAYMNLDFVEDIEAFIKDTPPCLLHGSPWVCFMSWRNPENVPSALQMLSDINCDAFVYLPDSAHFFHPIDELANSAVYDFFVKDEKRARATGHLDYDSVSILLRSYKILLDTMKRQSRESLPLPMHVISNLHKIFLSELGGQHDDDSFNGTLDTKPLSFLLKALDMALSAGAKIQQQEKCSLSTPSCRCTYLEQPYGFCMERDLLRRFVKPRNINGVTVYADSAFFGIIGEFYEILFIHGNKPGRHWKTFFCQIMKFQQKELFKLAEVSLSLMDHEDWQCVQRKLHIMHKRTARSIPSNAAEKEAKASKLEVLETFQQPTSLQHMCRKLLYDNIPNRRMAKYVDCLPLPPPTKQYLLFK